MAEAIRRCAIYTRKSTEDGLEQEFNSLDAQYEACKAYALSQTHEGWQLIEARYDDGGFSGGNMERPGLKRLLADVAAGLVDIILVYKIDRLTRALSDFSRIVDVLDKAEASFVSITQAFNTTTSMGRLTLNMLLSFAQFEREVTGERIRDKIAASKKKGIWMGGPVPLGYKVKDRKLLPVKKEAGQVRHIMELYCKLGSVPALVEGLAKEGLRTKVQERASGPHKGGCAYRRGTLYHLLSNPIYRGKLKHKGEVFDGEHEAIVSEELWDEVQFRLKANTSGSSRRKRHEQPSLLTGLIEDSHGRPMTPSHSGKSKKTQRYRYYVTRPDALGDKPATRVPANDLEDLVCEHLAKRLGETSFLLDCIGTHEEAGTMLQLAKRQADLACASLRSGTASAKRKLVCAVISKAALHEEEITVELDESGLAETLELETINCASDSLKLNIPATRQRSGHQLRLVVPERGDEAMAEKQAEPDLKLATLIHEAFKARDLVLANPTMSMNALAKHDGRCRTRLTRLVEISCLAPRLVEAIAAGKQDEGLTPQALLNRPIPLDWREQADELISH